MAKYTIAFLIWVSVGILFIFIGIGSAKSKKTVGFWSNIKPPQITDITSYNKTVGKLWITFGILFIITGLPLLAGQNSPWILLSVFGVVFEVIALMVICILIEAKYRKK